MRADISSFMAMILDVFSSLFYVAYISLCASIDLVRSVWSKPDILLSVHEVVEEVRDSSIECVRFVIPYLTFPRIALAWARTTKDWAGARVIARRMQMQADPVLEANVPVEVVESQTTANAERKTVAFSSLPDFIPCVDPSPSPSPSIPFKFDFNFAKRREVPAFFGSPNSTSGAKSPLSPSTKESCGVNSKSNSPRTRFVPPLPSTIPFPIRPTDNFQPCYPQTSFEGPRYPRFPAMILPSHPPPPPFLQTNHDLMAVNEARLQAIERLQLARAVRERNISLAWELKAQIEKRNGLGLMVNRRAFLPMPMGAAEDNGRKAMSESPSPIRVKTEETSISLRFSAKEEKASKPPVKATSPRFAHQNKKPDSKPKEQVKSQHGRRRGPRFFKAAKADAALKKSKKNQKVDGDVVAPKKVAAQPTEFKSTLRATAPEFVMRTTLGDKTNA